MENSTVDPNRGRFPYCIVWSPLGPITWLLPFVGHTGICDSDGVIYDFAGPYTINRGNMAFGAPTRYIQLDPKLCREMDWNRAVQEGCGIYCHRMHNIFCDNCHSHIAKCLNLMAYNNKKDRGMVHIAVWFFFCGSFCSVLDFVKTYLPFCIIATIVALAATGFFS